MVPEASTDQVFVAALRILDDAHGQGMPETDPNVVAWVHERRTFPDGKASRLSDQLLIDLHKVALWRADPNLLVSSDDRILADWQDVLTGRTRSRPSPLGTLPIITAHHDAITDTIRTWYAMLTPHLAGAGADLADVSFLAHARFTLEDAHTLLAAAVNPRHGLPVTSQTGSVMWALHRDSWPSERVSPDYYERARRPATKPPAGPPQAFLTDVLTGPTWTRTSADVLLAIALWEALDEDEARFTQDLPGWLTRTGQWRPHVDDPVDLVMHLHAWYALIGHLAPWFAAAGYTLTQAHTAHTHPDPAQRPTRDHLAVAAALTG